MPLYDFKCSDCSTIFEVSCKISEKSDPKPCPNCSSAQTEFVLLTAPSIADPVRVGVRKMDNGFKEVLQKIHEKTPGSRLKDNI